MHPLIIFLLTFQPIKNIIPARTYISNHIQNKINNYIILPDVDELMCVNFKTENLEEFFKYLPVIGVEFKKSGEYYFFYKKQ